MTTRECTHCGLEFSDGGDRSDSEPVFCCAGCKAVYHALHDSDLDEFYRHRASWSVDDPRPVDEEVLESDETSMFDNPAFLDDHAERYDDGTLGVELHLEGVHCAGCVWLVERMPRLVDGVVDARLELTRGRMTVRWNPDTIELSHIAEWLTQFGFQAHPMRSNSVRERSGSSRRMLMRVGVCWAVAINVMLLTIAVYAGLDADADPGLYATVLWTTFGLSLVSLVVGATVFFRRALANLRMRRLSMNVPISLGIAVGWGHSAWATFTGSGEVWFDSIVILTAALLTARYLQIRGNSIAADAADRLVSLLPKTARRIREDDSDEAVPADALEVGDRIRVLPGDVIPADGRVLDGRGEVSRAVLTGESRPNRIGPGETVEAGTKCVSSPLVIEVTATGDATRVGRLMEWVESKTTDRADIVQLADRLSGVFVAVVLLAATATAIAWSFIDPSRVVANVVALLVIACPCALGMATPLALTVGAGRAARRGIHIKRDEVLEALNGVTDVVFDKTGTLTYGRPDVAEIAGDVETAIRACSLETRSNHPLAAALLRWARNRSTSSNLAVDEMHIEQLEETPGAGITGVVDGTPMAVGRLSWFNHVPESLRRRARQYAHRGLTPVAVAAAGQVQSVLGVGDELRPEAANILDNLREQGVRVHLLSGDHADVVAAAGRKLDLLPEHVHGGVTPEQKLEYIERLRARRDASCIAMVGDGVNDAAALEAADVGIAVHGGTEASLASADVFMGKQGIEPVAELLDGCRETMHVVRRNLAGSGVYNLFGISLAAMGFITPLAAAILMPLSSLGVVTSSLIQNSFDDDHSPRPTPFVDVPSQEVAA